MQSTLNLKHAVMLLIALNCVLYCAAQSGGNGGVPGAPGAPGGGSNGGSPGAPGGWGGDSGAPGAPGAPGGGNNGGAPGSPGASDNGYSLNAVANSGFTNSLQWLLVAVPFTFALKYI